MFCKFIKTRGGGDRRRASRLKRPLKDHGRIEKKEGETLATNRVKAG